jgi:hypothetical protein
MITFVPDVIALVFLTVAAARVYKIRDYYSFT